MLTLNAPLYIEGVTIYRDDLQANLFYLIPQQPRFRIDDTTKKPVFRFIKYKMPVGRPDGSKGGGFVIFDSEFTVPDDKLKKITDQLNQMLQAGRVNGPDGRPLQAAFGRPTFTSGTATLTLLDSGGALVQKILSPGKPSLYGNLICCFTCELSPEGAAVAEALLKGSGGGAQIAYDMHCTATLPPITGRVWFYASKFYSFYQSIDKSGGSWDSSDNTENDTLREAFMNSQSGGVFFDFSNIDMSDPEAAKKTEESIRNWGWSQIDEAVKTAILPDIKAADDRGDHGMEHIQKMQSTWESSSFNRYFQEKDAVDFHLIPQGTLPNIVDMGFKWNDFYMEVDANDPFFVQINASVAVNADFDLFGIDSVDAHFVYPKSNPPTIQDFHFKKPDDVGKFLSETVGGDMKYAYSFTVNYKDANQPYQSATKTQDNAQVTVNANDLGILFVNMTVGSVDFTQVKQVQATIRYQDAASGIALIEREVTFDKDTKAQHLTEVLGKPRTRPYQYQITYIMADGKQLVTDWKDRDANELPINSPFGMRTVSFLAEGDFADDIESIFVKMKYTDDAAHYGQDKGFMFSAAHTSFDWTFPVVNQGQGQITYSGVITYKDHTTETLADASTTKDLVEFGPPNQGILTVTPSIDLIDFSKVKLVKLNLEYQDSGHNIDKKQEYVLKQGSNPQPWKLYLRDPNQTSYTWQATYYMAGSASNPVKTNPATSSDTMLVLEGPPA